MEALTVNPVTPSTVWCVVGNGGMDPYSSPYIIPIVVSIVHSPFPTKNQTEDDWSNWALELPVPIPACSPKDTPDSSPTSVHEFRVVYGVP